MKLIVESFGEDVKHSDGKVTENDWTRMSPLHCDTFINIILVIGT